LKGAFGAGLRAMKETMTGKSGKKRPKDVTKKSERSYKACCLTRNKNIHF
jgi:hypothetical protein